MAESPPFLAATLRWVDESLINLGDVSSGLHDAETFGDLNYPRSGYGSTAPGLITDLQFASTVVFKGVAGSLENTSG